MGDRRQKLEQSTVRKEGEEEVDHDDLTFQGENPTSSSNSGKSCSSTLETDLGPDQTRETIRLLPVWKTIFPSVKPKKTF
ncbi:hypothetical protein J4Q44_G00129760 [Coregonus suidteri]|uniref:Uncharacterized protein n=1 Tax=Coregonus suidteri TaxID=861788 RepID=A0AAN8M528_9TELE